MLPAHATEEFSSMLVATHADREEGMSRLPAREHMVQFCESEAFVRETAARFIGAGLAAGEIAVTVTTDVRGAALRERLSANGFDVARLVEQGRLVALDAEAEMAHFMRDGEPSRDAFVKRFGDLLDGLERRTPGERLRIYGDMVDVLWRRGHRKGAVRLEEFWDELMPTRSFSLLCAYLLDEHYTATDVALLEDVCRRRTHVAVQDDAQSPGGNPRVREIGALRHERAQSEQRFRLLVESVKDYAIFMLDPLGHVASWNVGARRIKGYEEREIIGSHFSVFYPREDVEAGKCEYELEMAQREGRFEDEGWRIRKDGSTFWASVVITALYDEAAQLVGFAKVTRDLTARREAEDERVRRARAEEAERRAKDFLAILGHELRNPLAPIATAVQLIKLRRGVKCDKEIAVLERQIAHVLSLVADLLDVSRALHGKIQLTIKPVDIGEVLANAIDIASPLIQQRQHVLQLEAPDGPLQVEVDPERTVQVFSNLLNNAAKYTDPGGEIRVRFRGKDDFVEIAIEDTGIGIAPEFIEHVYDLFQQGEEGRHGHSGLGIGLAVARRLVTQQGGTIAVTSEGHGRGSCFTVRLPSAQSSVPTSDAPPPPPPEPRVLRRILVVDDNTDAAEMLRIVLEHFGHEVAVASNGPEGLDVAGRFQPDIAFLDIGLPGMSGFELVRRMRQMPETADIPIVAVSGYARDVDRARSKEAGFSAHVAKPFDVLQLEQLVDGAGLVPR